MTSRCAQHKEASEPRQLKGVGLPAGSLCPCRSKVKCEAADVKWGMGWVGDVSVQTFWPLTILQCSANDRVVRPREGAECRN